MNWMSQIDRINLARMAKKSKNIKTVKHDENNVIHSSFDGLTITWLTTKHSVGNAIGVGAYKVYIQ